MSEAYSFLEVLSVRQIEELVFENITHRENFRSTLFGGQVLAQALMAATHTVEGRNPHSLHAYFLRAGSSDAPVRYHVEKTRDGRSISSRRVVAMQFDRPIFYCSASYHIEEAGFEHQDTAPTDIPDPETLLRDSESHAVAETADDDNESSPFQLLPIPENLFSSTEQHAPDALFWLKARSPLPEQPALQAAALAFVSDLGLLATAVLPHPASLFDPSIVAASIDHAMWFHHHDYKVSDWMLCRIHSPWAGNARGFSQASIFDRGGKLIASTAQEGLIRPS